MSDRLYYLLSFLPVLPPLGEKPPLSAEEVFKVIKEEQIEKARVVAGIFEFETRLLRAVRDKYLAYSSEEVPDSPFGQLSQPVVDTFLKDPSQMGEDVWFTELWINYLIFLKDAGKRIGSELLSLWAEWEMSLRGQLASARIGDLRASAGKEEASANTLSVQGAAPGPPVRPSGEAPIPDVGKWDHGDLIARWRTAQDPMAGERLLDEARMQFIEAGARRYSFGIDELVAYFLKLGLLSRYMRLDREEGLKILEEVTAL